MTIDSAADRSPHVRVLVAARDEDDRLGATLAALGRAFPGAPVWVADDGSRDATATVARAAGAHVVRSERVIGKGAAMSAAARAALGHGGAEGGAEAVFVLCDGDLADSARELVALADAVVRGEADLAIAVFATRAGGGLGLAVGFARWAIRARCGLQTRAPISGQRALSGAALARVLPFAAGYGMEIGMTIDAVRAGRRVVELELNLSHRASGRTLAGFLHRGRQLVDFARVYGRRRPARAAHGA
ncbi:MAG TPA: glycosyltransferase [Solirubrobacteraceae bacterium]|jgi:glycosyltransferase involved in cell wall biosynthesis